MATSEDWRVQRVRAALAAFACCLAAILVKLWWMQVVEFDRWQRESLDALTRNNSIPAARGIIYDRQGPKGSHFASNEAQWAVVVTPEDVEGYRPGPWRSPIPPTDKTEWAREMRCPDPPEGFSELAKAIAEIVNSSPSRSGASPQRRPIDPAKIADKLCEYSWAPYKEVTVATHLDRQAWARIHERRHELTGVRIDRQFLRKYHYPKGANAFHLLGYVQGITQREKHLFSAGYEPTDVVGKSGVEGYYENVLKGIKGREISQPKKPPRIDPPPKPGQDLTLSVDAGLQAAIEESLARNVEFYRGDAGAAVALDPQSGAVYALASYPTFSSEWFAPEHPPEFDRFIERVVKDRASERFPWSNHVTQSTRTPASTFKMVTLTAGLEEGVIDPDRYIVVCTGRTMLGGAPRNCWQRRGHGAVGVTMALAQSCNTFFYHVGVRLGERRLVDWARRFGFGDRTGIDLPEEAKGLVGDRAYLMNVLGEDGWFDGHSANMAIGEGTILATPLQVAVATAVIANGGRRIVPSLQAELTDAGKPQEPMRQEREVAYVNLSPRTLSFVRRGMRGVVMHPLGTAYQAFHGESSVPVAVAGKTGSSERAAGDAWFTCYAPYVAMDPDNPETVSRAATTPKIVVTVLIINGGHGGDSAAPVARDAIRAAFDDRGRFLLR